MSDLPDNVDTNESQPLRRPTGYVACPDPFLRIEALATHADSLQHSGHVFRYELKDRSELDGYTWGIGGVSVLAVAVWIGTLSIAKYFESVPPPTSGTMTIFLLTAFVSPALASLGLLAILPCLLPFRIWVKTLLLSLAIVFFYTPVTTVFLLLFSGLFPQSQRNWPNNNELIEMIFLMAIFVAMITIPVALLVLLRQLFSKHALGANEVPAQSRDLTIGGLFELTTVVALAVILVKGLFAGVSQFANPIDKNLWPLAIGAIISLIAGCIAFGWLSLLLRPTCHKLALGGVVLYCAGVLVGGIPILVIMIIEFGTWQWHLSLFASLLGGCFVSLAFSGTVILALVWLRFCQLRF